MKGICKQILQNSLMNSVQFDASIGGGNDGHWLIDPMDNVKLEESNLLGALKDVETYQNFYYDCYGYPNHQSETQNTDYTGTITSTDGDYPLYQYAQGKRYYENIRFVFEVALSDKLSVFYHMKHDDEPFYYHSDHLGSAAWITDKNGLPVQYLMYAPYGERLLNQQSTPYNERFTFTGKERDKETGYVHFDARNLFEVASIWLSPDPLLDKYIYNSPYVYCEGNPIGIFDPDGRDTLHFDADGNYTHRVQSEGPHIGIWHKSNNAARDFRFQDPNDANRFMTDEEYENSDMSIDRLEGIKVVSLSSVYKATRPTISDRLKGRYIAALSGKANGSMDYMRLNEPNYNMAYKSQHCLMLVDGIPLAQQPYNMGNMLWGLKMHRLGFSLPACLLGAHAYTIYGGITGKYPKIELDSFDDQCSITLGYMLWPGF